AEAEQGDLPRLLGGDAEAQIKVEPGEGRARATHRLEWPTGDNLAGGIAQLEVPGRLEEPGVAVDSERAADRLANTRLQSDDVGGQTGEAWRTNRDNRRSREEIDLLADVAAVHDRHRAGSVRPDGGAPVLERRTF